MALYRSVVRLRCSQYVMDIVMWIGFVGGALYGWVHGRMTAGDFVMVTTLTGSLLQTAYTLGQRIPDFYDQLGSAHREHRYADRTGDGPGRARRAGRWRSRAEPFTSIALPSPTSRGGGDAARATLSMISSFTSRPASAWDSSARAGLARPR